MCISATPGSKPDPTTGGYVQVDPAVRSQVFAAWMEKYRLKVLAAHGHVVPEGSDVQEAPALKLRTTALI
jgi:hypothetical protein